MAMLLSEQKLEQSAGLMTPHCVLPGPFEGMGERLYIAEKLLGTLFYTVTIISQIFN